MKYLYFIFTTTLLLTGLTLFPQRQQLGNSTTYWEIRNNDILYISGSGAMPDFNEGTAPWYNMLHWLQGVQLENGITHIGNYAFFRCVGMRTFTLPNSLISIGDYAFSKCSMLTSMAIPDGVVTLGDYVFSECTFLASVTIPNSVTTIGSYAFFKCTGISSITLPNSVKNIKSYAFSGCGGLSSINIPDRIKTIESGVFSNCYRLTSMTIPDSVTSIGNEAFSNCIELVSITIPNNVISIGNSAFSNCRRLPFVAIPNSVTSIGNEAFSNCEAFTSITIPRNVNSIGNNAFSKCTGLTNVINLNPIPVFIEENVFLNVNVPVCTLTVSNYAVERYHAADVWKDFIITVSGFDLSVNVNSSALGMVDGFENKFYDHNERITLTAVPSESSVFENWTSNGTVISTDNPFVFSITSDTTIMANFRNDEISTYDIIKEQDEILLYPNPVRNILYFRTNYVIQEVTLYNMSGKVLKNIPNPNPEIDISYLPKGIYIIMIRTSNREFSQKIMKQ